MPTSKKRRRPAGSARPGGNGVAPPLPAEDSAATPVPEPAPGAAPARRFPIWVPRTWWQRLFLGLGIGLVLIIAGLAGYFYWIIQRGLPTLNGTAALPGLSASATVVRDSSGIPHITAATVNDLYMAQGYVHAQDRLFQMDIARRFASGQVSELVGAGTVEGDRVFRTLGLRRAAEAAAGTLPADVRAALEAYAAGVNAFINSHQDALPLEYTMLGAKPAPWTPADTLVFGKFMAWQLTSAQLANELVTADLRAALGPEKVQELLPGYPADQPIITRQAALPGRATSSLRGLAPYLGGAGIGSNNWVIAGARTATGKPLLANDPHLTVQNPAVWYFNHLRTADGTFEVAGVSLAGSPGVVIGHNNAIAWGMTNLGADLMDLYVETVDPTGHPGQYRHNGAWQPFTYITETVRVKDGPELTLTITSTVHGPLINPVTTDIEAPTALAWSVAGPDRQVIALLRLQTARDWDGFRAALADWDAPSLNFVYADTAGNIGYQATGKIPIRKAGDGTAPADGATGAQDWTGFIPFDQLPSIYNPPDGVIVTANNRVVGEDYPHLLTAQWSPGYRAARILQLISETQKLSLDDSKRIQLDVRSTYAQEVAPYFAGLKTDDPQLQPLVSRFAGWDGALPADSATAALYEVAYHRLLSATVTSALSGTLAADYIVTLPGEASLFMRKTLRDANSPWWNDPATPEQEDRDARLLATLQQAAQELREGQGDDPTAWQWGALHRIYFPHPLGIPPLDGVFNVGPLPTGGDGTTVNTGYAPGLRSFLQLYYPSMRQVTEVGNWDAMQVILAPGQSGQPFSRYWNNMTADWLAGVYRPLRVAPGSIQADAQGTLTLTP
jgi:penicillin amidase